MIRRKSINCSIWCLSMPFPWMTSNDSRAPKCQLPPEELSLLPNRPLTFLYDAECLLTAQDTQLLVTFSSPTLFLFR